MARAVTIYDVAEAAGVAASTVSRAFSRPGRVNAQTAERIRLVAERLGYHANPLAQGLSARRTGMIALMISDITNPFSFPIIRGAETAAAEAGYTLLLSDARESDRLEREALERSLASVDGIVLASSRMSDSAIRVLAKQKPMIVLNRAVSDVPSVVTDNPRGTRRAAEHLGSLGHDRLTYVAGPEASWADGMRWRALREAGLELELRVRRIGPVAPTVRGGAAAVQQWWRQPTSGILAYNDLIAIGLIRELAARGVSVPGDVSVIGFDDIFAASLISPPLTTVAAPLHALGSTASRNLIALIGGATSLRAGRPAVLPARLVLRESTARRADGWNRPGGLPLPRGN